MVDWNPDLTPPKYGPPNMAAELYKMIRGIPQAYEEGQENRFKEGQRRRTEQLQQPILGPDGQPTQDPMAIATELARRYPEKSLEFPVTALQTKATQEAFKNRGREPPDFPGGDQGGGGGTPSERITQYTGGAQPRADMAPDLGPEPPAGTVNPARIGNQPQNLTGPTILPPGGQTTVRKIAEAAGIDPDTPGFEEQFTGVGLDRPIHPDVARGVQAKIENLRQAGMFGPVEGVEQPPASPQSGPPPGAGPPGVGPGSVYSQKIPPPATYTAPLQPYLPPSPAPAPQGDRIKTQAEIDAMRNRASALIKDAQFVPALAATNKLRAENINKAADKAQEALNKKLETTDPEIIGTKTRQEAVNADIKHSKEKVEPGIMAAGVNALNGMNKLQRIRTQMSDPNFSSGAGHEVIGTYRSWLAALPGGDPNAAEPMQEFHKVTKQLLADDIKAMGQVAGPVRVAEVNIMNEGTARLGISEATNRLLVEESWRARRDIVEQTKMAQDYLKTHTHLDSNFYAMRDKWIADHPLYTAKEIANPKLVAPPYLPPLMEGDAGKERAFARRWSIKKGDPIVVDDPKHPNPDGSPGRKVINSPFGKD